MCKRYEVLAGRARSWERGQWQLLRQWPLEGTVSLVGLAHVMKCSAGGPRTISFVFRRPMVIFPAVFDVWHKRTVHWLNATTITPLSSPKSTIILPPPSDDSVDISTPTTKQCPVKTINLSIPSPVRPSGSMATMLMVGRNHGRFSCLRYDSPSVACSCSFG